MACQAVTWLPTACPALVLWPLARCWPGGKAHAPLAHLHHGHARCWPGELVARRWCWCWHAWCARLVDLVTWWPVICPALVLGSLARLWRWMHGHHAHTFTARARQVLAWLPAICPALVVTWWQGPCTTGTPPPLVACQAVAWCARLVTWWPGVLGLVARLGRSPGAGLVAHGLPGPGAVAARQVPAIWHTFTARACQVRAFCDLVARRWCWCWGWIHGHTFTALARQALAWLPTVCPALVLWPLARCWRWMNGHHAHTFTARARQALAWLPTACPAVVLWPLAGCPRSGTPPPRARQALA